MKIWITQYALTSGIKECDATVPQDPYYGGRMAVVGQSYFHLPHWHTTPEAAQLQAELMRLKKLKSLERSIAKLKALRFTCTPSTAQETIKATPGQVAQ
jgi:hypothetical protein